MIGRVVGKIVFDAVDAVVVDVHGVGYEITVPLGAVGRAPRSGDEITLVIHTHVREDDISLYGFASEIDRFAFRTLISVSNVGPRTALAVLGAMTAEELAMAIARKDVGKLTSISGIGKKTAERLVLELAGKLPVTPIGPQTDVQIVKPPAAEADVLLGALTKMGYRPSEAERAVSNLGDRIAGRPLAESLKEALALLAK